MRRLWVWEIVKILLEWKNPDPFIIKIGEKIAGFVFVKKIEKENVDYTSIAEFFVLKKYRKLGIGKAVAKMVFGKFTGKWYVDVIKSNEPACSFWEKVISDYTNGKFASSEDKEQKKKIFTFESK